MNSIVSIVIQVVRSNGPNTWRSKFLVDGKFLVSELIGFIDRKVTVLVNNLMVWYHLVPIILNVLASFRRLVWAVYPCCDMTLSLTLSVVVSPDLCLRITTKKESMLVVVHVGSQNETPTV